MATKKNRTKDPPVRRDKKCVVCGGERKILDNPIYPVEEDPFCSTKCCREWWGTSEEPISRDMSRKEVLKP